MHGFLDKIGDLSWIGPTYADKGWVELTEAEQEALRKAKVMARVESEKSFATEKLSDPTITVGDKSAWSEYLMTLDSVCLCPDFDCDPKFPTRP